MQLHHKLALSISQAIKEIKHLLKISLWDKN